MEYGQLVTNWSDFLPAWRLPSNLRFETELRDTEIPVTKKLVKRYSDGTSHIGAYVGSNQGVKSHDEFFGEVIKSLLVKFNQEDRMKTEIKWSSCYNDLFVVMDMRFPTVCNKFTWQDQNWEKSLRLIIVRSINGKASTSAFFGDIDWFCMNTLISGNFQSIRERNTTNFNPISFANKIPELKNKFLENAFIEQEYTKIPVKDQALNRLFNDFFPDETNDKGEQKKNLKKKEFFDLYDAEAKERGETLYSVMSTFSRYSAHKPLRNTKSTQKWTTKAFRDHQREIEVQKMMASTQWYDFLQYHSAPIYQH